MWRSERTKSMNPPRSLPPRNASFRLRSIDRLVHLDETTTFSPPRKEHSSNITEFVFSDTKKKKEISRIIDNYFDDSSEHRAKKTFSLIQFPKATRVDQRRTSIRTKFTATLDHHNQVPNNTFPVIETTPFLPPIFEEEPDQPQRFNAFLLKTISEAPSPKCPLKYSRPRGKETRNVEVNERFVISLDKTTTTKSFSLLGISYLFLQLKSSQIVQRLGVELMYTYDGKNTLSYEAFSPLRKQLYTVTEQTINSERAFLITASPFYWELFNNDNELLLHLIKSILLMLHRIRGKVINNNLNMANLHYLKGNLVADSWATAAIQENKLSQLQSHTVFPCLRNGDDWFVQAEYLPPQLLESIDRQTKLPLFQYPSSIDMWSLGSLILEMVTLIPLYTPHKWTVDHSKRIRRGLYFGKSNDLPSLWSRQRKLCRKLRLQLQRAGELPTNLDKKVTLLLCRMMKEDPSERLTPEEALRIIG